MKIKKALAVLIAAMSVSPVWAAQPVSLESSVTADMCTSSYWKEKLGADADKIVLDKKAIKELNKVIYSSKDTLMNDLENMDEKFDAKITPYTVPENEYYINGEKIDNKEYFSKIIDAFKKTCYVGEMKTKYAVVTKRVNVKAWPTDDILGYSPDDTDDEIQSTALNVNEPFVIRQRCIIDGKTYYRGYCTCDSGWVDGDSVAVCSSKEEWLKAWKVDLEKDDFLVVTGDKIITEPSLFEPDTSQVALMIGTVLRLVPDNEKPQTIGERGLWNNYCVYLPSRDENGKYKEIKTLISQHEKVSVGYLPMTKGNVLDVAFNCLGDRYGWGGMEGAMDCSLYTRQIYKCFGVEMPRNTNTQTKIEGHFKDISGMDVAQKTDYIKSLSPGSLIMFKGHITLYLGEENGKLYVISATGSVSDGAENAEVGVRMSVIINPLDVRRANGTTWLENAATAVIF